MENLKLLLKQVRIGAVWGALYFGQKVLVNYFILEWVIKHYGYGGGYVFILLDHAIISGVQMFAYNKAKKVFHTDTWVHQIKAGKINYQWQRYLTKLFNSRWGVLSMFIITVTQLDAFWSMTCIVETKTVTWKPWIVFAVSYLIGALYTIVVAPAVRGFVLLALTFVLAHVIWFAVALAIGIIYITLRQPRVKRILRFIQKRTLG